MSKKDSHKHHDHKDTHQPAAEQPVAEAEKPSHPQPPAEDWKARYDELFGQFQRLAADFQNYQKRSMRQTEQSIQHERDGVARMLLPALDNFEHTLQKGAEIADQSALLKGIQIVYDHMMGILSNFGIKKIEIRPGLAFDPSRHEAMMQEESTELAANTVVRELACGYLMQDRTIRPAKVSVAKTPSTHPAPGMPPCPDDEHTTRE